MIAKLIIWGRDRGEAIRRTRRALGEFRIRGVRTPMSFYRAILDDADFRSGQVTTAFLSPERTEALGEGARNDEIAVLAAAIAAFQRDCRPVVEASRAQASPWQWSYR
jgi:acetyl/propionyl-CoA carboxylase alpha subunit